MHPNDAFENEVFRIRQSVYEELSVLHQKAERAILDSTYNYKRMAILLFSSLKQGQPCKVEDVANILMEFISDDMKALIKSTNKTSEQTLQVRKQKKKTRIYARRTLQYMSILQRNEQISFEEEDECDRIIEDFRVGRDQQRTIF
jgi:hypothetical protein